MTKRMAMLAVASVLVVAGCGHHPSEAACKTAMRGQLAYGFAHAGDPNAQPVTKPKACEGLDDKTLERLGNEVLEGR